MNKEDICYMSAFEMAEKINTQELTSLEIAETIIERIEKINPIINTYCITTFDLELSKGIKTIRRDTPHSLTIGISGAGSKQ